jgi:hypothetical protein
MSKKRKMGISNLKRFKLDLYNKFIFQMKLRLLGLPIIFSTHTFESCFYGKIQKGLPIEEATPFWRVISPQTPIAKKLSFGTDFLLKMRKEEGIS